MCFLAFAKNEMIVGIVCREASFSPTVPTIISVGLRPPPHSPSQNKALPKIKLATREQNRILFPAS